MRAGHAGTKADTMPRVEECTKLNSARREKGVKREGREKEQMQGDVHTAGWLGGTCHSVSCADMPSMHRITQCTDETC